MGRWHRDWQNGESRMASLGEDGSQVEGDIMDAFQAQLDLAVEAGLHPDTIQAESLSPLSEQPTAATQHHDDFDLSAYGIY
jgi:hypothetical protein